MQQISQKALEEATGISQSQISKLLRGIRIINIDELYSLCSALNLSPAQILTKVTSLAKQGPPPEDS